MCLKCALEKLKVKEDWHAPVHRNLAEYAWLEVAARVNPEGSVRLLGRSSHLPCFAMEYVQGSNIYLWKSALLDGKVALDEAASVGRAIGRVHATSAATGFLRRSFENRNDFHKLRLDPYLIFTARQHPAVASVLKQLVDELYQSAAVLVHGDVSPKNILFRDGNPIILDAECATMGDASFDVAFCLNHLVLKALHVTAIRNDLFEATRHLWETYRAQVNWEDTGQLEQRICRLLPALMLTRIDGKSPVEYLEQTNRRFVRMLKARIMH